MTGERIEDMREVVLPFVRKRLTETNYENLGESDAKEFERDFNEILNLAIKALEQEPILDKIRAEIESKMESVIGHYDSTTPIYDMASYKVERNKVREECMDIIDKYRQEG